MFLSRTTRPQRASSSRRHAPNSALDVGAGSGAGLHELLVHIRRFDSATTASCSLAMTAGGVRAGASRPYQFRQWCWKIPAPRGWARRPARHCGVADAPPSGLSVPPLIWVRAPARRRTWPHLPAEEVGQRRRRAAIGHVQEFHPGCRRNSSSARCVMLPTRSRRMESRPASSRPTRRAPCGAHRRLRLDHEDVLLRTTSVTGANPSPGRRPAWRRDAALWPPRRRW